MIMTFDVPNFGYPPEQRTSTATFFVQPVYETLGRYDESGRMVPWLAERWEIDPGGPSITFFLNKGILFHDGTLFDAEAVKWNIEAYQAAARPEVSGIASIDVIDQYTVRLNMEEWNNTLLENVAHYVKMTSPSAVEANGVEWAANNPVGTGPFKLESYERDVYLKFVKNEDYWIEGLPYLDSIEYTIIQDRHTGANYFKSGEADVLVQMDPETYEDLLQSGKYFLRQQSGIGAAGYGLIYDSGNPESPFHDVRVRKAVAHAIDREAIVQAIWRGQGTTGDQWNPESSYSYNPNIVGYDYNPEKAKQLLAEAGYPNGFKTKLIMDTSRAAMGAAVQNYLKEVGIEADISVVDQATWISYITDKWDGIILWLRIMSPNAAMQINRTFSKQATNYAKNVAIPEGLEEMLQASLTEPDFDKAVQIIHDMQKIIFDEHALGLPIVNPQNAIATQLHVQNLEMYARHGYDWNPESVWRKP